jgi:TPR repeat protein
MAQLGRFYLEGDDEIRDVDQAFEWFSRTARSHSVEGMYFLATMTRNGDGVNAISEAARFWFESAAAKGKIPTLLSSTALNS